MPDAPPRPLPCIHCRYDLRAIGPDKNCPECGKPVSDTREGTFFYSLAPSRLAAVTIGTGLFGLAISAWVVAHLLGALTRTVDASLFESAVGAVARFVECFNYAYIPLLLLAVPLTSRASPWTPLRLIVLASFFLGGLASLVSSYTSTTAGPRTFAPDQLVAIAVSIAFDAVILAGLIRVYRHGLLLPGRPFQSLGAGAIIAWTVFMLVHHLPAIPALSAYNAPIVIASVVSPLLMIPAAAVTLLQFRELRAISRDIDKTHPFASRLT